MRALRSAALGTPLFRRNLLTDDGEDRDRPRSAKDRVPCSSNASDAEARAAVVALDRAGGVSTWPGPVLESSSDRMTRRENAIFIPVSFTAVVLMLWILFRCGGRSRWRSR